MFNFLYKTILHHQGRSTITPSLPTHNLLYCLLNSKSDLFSPRYISNNTTQHSFTVSYLINSCGFSLDSALSASKHVHFETPDNPDSVLQFFKEHKFSQTQIKNLTTKLPQVLLSTPEETLFPKFNFFQDLGLSPCDIAKLFTRCPGLFNRSVEQHLGPSVDAFTDLVGSKDRAIALIKSCPSILYHDLKDYVEPNLETLQRYRVPRQKILMFLRHRPHLIITNPEDFKKIVEEVREMNIAPFMSRFIQAIVAKMVVSKSQWETKLDIYKKWGLSEEQVLAAFRIYPWCMMTSSDKIETVMDIFVNKLGWKPSVVVECPMLVTVSVEEIIIPRAAVLQFFISKGLDYGSMGFGGPKIFLCSEITFLEGFEYRFNEDINTQVYKLYQEKIDLSKKTKRSNAQRRPKDQI